MLESLRDIGRFSLKDRGKSPENVLSILLENPGGEDYTTVVALTFEGEENDPLQYHGLDIESVNLENYERYLYKRKGAAGPNYTPCSLVAGKGLVGTFKNRIYTWAKNNQNGEGIIGRLAIAILDAETEILNNLLQKDKEEDLSGTILTVKINGKYPGEISHFTNYFLETYYQAKSEVAFENGICSLCGKEGFVMGNEKPWTFYSLDKPGFIASGFMAKNGWKNFPICKKCSLLVEEGKQHIENWLNFRFAGIRYFLLPKSILGNETVLEEALLFLEKERITLLKTAVLKRLSDDEDEIFQFASEQSDALVYNFLFYESAKAKFTILLYLPDVLPSTIRKLFMAKERVERFSIFKQVYKQRNEFKDVDFTFNNIRIFIKTPKTFLNIVEKIFKRKPIDYFYLLNRFLDHLRQQFVQERFTKPDTLRAFQILLLLQELNILANKPEGDIPMDNVIIQNEVKGKVEEFFGQFSDTFNTPEKRAVFLTGVLTQFLLNIQRRDRGSEPFRKNLKGLKMRQKDILQVFPKAQNKLEEYGENYYTQLEQVIAEYFVQAGSNWNITDDEINFYFLLGMDLADAQTKDNKPIFKADSSE